MQKILVVIKLNDNVIISSELAHNLILGDKDDFFDAQTLVINALQPDPDLTGFINFLSAYKNLGLDQPLACLYYLAKKVPFVTEIATVGNFLNYFAFTYTINNENLANDFSVLHSTLFSLPAVSHWWCESPMQLCEAPTYPPPPVSPVNLYYDSLKFQDFSPARGKGVTIIDAEDYGDQPQHPYLADLLPSRSRVIHPAFTTKGARIHFYKTLGVLFAHPPARSTTSSPLPTNIRRPVIGLVPNAELAIMAFDYTAISDNLDDAFIPNFFARKQIPDLLAKTPPLTNQGNILLFERMVPITVGNDREYNLPLEVLPDMRKAMLSCRRKNIVVIQPSGELNGIDFNLDHALQLLLQLLSRQRYTNFNTPFTIADGLFTGSVCITVGALGDGHTILPDTNAGKIVDIYLWGKGIQTLTYPDPSIIPDPPLFDDYGFTSAASAIAAGITAALQSAAKASDKKLTTTQIKNVFNRTFRVGGVAFNPTTLQTLWEECQRELNPPPRRNPPRSGHPYVPQPDESGR